MIDSSKQTIDTYKKLGKKYIDSVKNGEPAVMNKILKILNDNSLILDVGCAGGRDAKVFTKAGHRVVGIDMVDEFLSEARKNVPKAEFKKMDLMKLDFPDSYFNLIWATAVLLHVPKKHIKRIIKSFYKKLELGGLLYVGVKRGRGERMTKEKIVDGLSRFFAFYYKHEMEQILKDCNFKIIESNIIRDNLGRSSLEWVTVIVKK